MADEIPYTNWGNTNDPVIHRSKTYNDHLVNRVLEGTAFVGDIIVANTFPEVDQCADNEAGLEIGIIVRPLIRPSDTWTAADELADEVEVEVLRFGSGSLIWLLISGQDSPVSGKDGQIVFSTTTDGSTNDSRDGSGSLNATQGPTAVIGKLNGDWTTGNATSAVNGTMMQVFI